MKLLPIVACAALAIPGARAETCKPDVGDRPVWVSEAPRGYAFDYFVGQGEDLGSPVNARALAVSNAIGTIVAKGLITVDLVGSSKQEEHSINDQSTLVTSVSEEITVKGSSTRVQGLEQVELHLEQCGMLHRAFSLVRIPRKNPEPPPSAMEPVWRSAIGPGWGQFYKGHSTRGALILVGEGLLIPTAAVTYILSWNAANDAAASTTQSDRNFYNDRSDKFYFTALLTGGTALALYVYNLIDAAASPARNVYADAAGEGPTLALAPNGLIARF